jgi:DNA-binding MurR/RpiR family transcriptional regulator
VDGSKDLLQEANRLSIWGWRVLRLRNELTAALAEEAKANEALDEFNAKAQEQLEALETQLTTQREPLIAAAHESSSAISVLIRERGSLLARYAAKPLGRTRPRKKYFISNESRVSGTIKRTTTKALQAGVSGKRAKNLGLEAGAKLAQKLGLTGYVFRNST